MNLLMGLYLCIGMAAATWWNFGKPKSGAITFQDGSGIAIHILERNKAVPKKVARVASNGIYYNNARAGERIERSGAITDLDLPEQCRGQNYCTVKRNNYPEDQFNEMFKDYKAPPESFQPELVPSLDVRAGNPDEDDSCPTLIAYSPLYHVKDESGNWRDVLQAPKSAFIQRVRSETCMDKGATCFRPFGFENIFLTHCEQLYNSWEVLVLAGTNGTEKIQTEIPVCCTCLYKRRA